MVKNRGTIDFLNMLDQLSDMSCPKCGNEIVGTFCSNCGYKVEKSSPEYNSPQNQQFSPTPVSTPYQQPQININYQQNNQPTPYPDWYKDGSIMGLILAIIGLIMFFTLPMFWGLIFGLIALIIVASSKKRNGRIFILSIILTTIAFVVEILVFGFIFLILLFFL